jgi:hypothetical protein
MALGRRWREPAAAGTRGGGNPQGDRMTGWQARRGLLPAAGSGAAARHATIEMTH